MVAQVPSPAHFLGDRTVLVDGRLLISLGSEVQRKLRSHNFSVSGSHNGTPRYLQRIDRVGFQRKRDFYRRVARNLGFHCYSIEGNAVSGHYAYGIVVVQCNDSSRCCIHLSTFGYRL